MVIGMEVLSLFQCDYEYFFFVFGPYGEVLIRKKN